MKNDYYCLQFEWNDYLEDIHAINISKEIRSSGKMLGWYTKPVNPRYYDENEEYYRKYYGVFNKGKLCAYLHIVLCGDFAFIRHFMGHANHLNKGIMNALISWTVQELINNCSQIKWINYGPMTKWYPDSIISFKRHAGFVGFTTFLDLEDDQVLLKFSKKHFPCFGKSVEF